MICINKISHKYIYEQIKKPDIAVGFNYILFFKSIMHSLYPSLSQLLLQQYQTVPENND